MTKMTLFNCDWRELSKQDLDAELRCQKALRTLISRELYSLNKASRTKKPSRIREDKIDFFEDCLKVFDGEIAEMQERFDSMVSIDFDKKDAYRKKHTAIKRNLRLHRREDALEMDKIHRDGINLSWDREKFMLVARDRGYLTEASVIHAVKTELAATNERAKVLLKNGRFTFGQVLCLGAMLHMTPKEFCDIFLSDYFVDFQGQFVASYDNLDKSVLLQRATALATKKELAELDAFAEQLKSE